ncbi:MAG: hypothetical protein AB8I08_13450 [Sandaracinaceae bacterium]
MPDRLPSPPLQRLRLFRVAALVSMLPAPILVRGSFDVGLPTALTLPFYAIVMAAITYQAFRLAQPWAKGPRRAVLVETRYPAGEWALLVGGLLSAYASGSFFNASDAGWLAVIDEEGLGVGLEFMLPSEMTMLAMAFVLLSVAPLLVVVRGGAVVDGEKGRVWVLGPWPRSLKMSTLRGVGVIETRWHRNGTYERSSFQAGLFGAGAKPRRLATLHAADANGVVELAGVLHGQTGLSLARSAGGEVASQSLDRTQRASR